MCIFIYIYTHIANIYIYIYVLMCVCVCVYVLVIQSCLILCDFMGCSLPGSSVHVTLQKRILECVAALFSRGFSQPRDWDQVSYIAGRFFTTWATREALYVCVCIYIYIYMCVCVCIHIYLNHFIVHLKIAWHCKSTRLWEKQNRSSFPDK